MHRFLHEFKGPMLSLLMLLTIAWGSVQAQSRMITGSVKDESNGDVLPGVNIQVKGTANGTISDQNGAFQVSVESDNDVLVFSFVGYKKEEIEVGKKTTIDIVLFADISTLEEIVVVGYGEQKKSVVTGAITKVSGESLTNVPNGRIETAIQGRVAGVTIAQNSGQPGSASTIRIRGVTTFGDGNNPLWVVDGVVVDAGGIGYLNQADIESIEVLKDATSAAIYGTRAATGVILVTTKKGSSGKFTIDYNGFMGVSSPARQLDVLNAQQYGYIMNERAIGGGGNPIFADPSTLGSGTDWQKSIFNKSAMRSNHQIGLQGGNEKSKFYVSLGYQKDEGIVATDISEFEKYNIRLNSSHKFSKVFTVSQTLGYTHTNSKGLGNTNSEYGGPLSSAINLDPITPVYETDPVKLSNPSLYPSHAVKDDNGNVFGISTSGMQEMSNPMAYIQTRLGRESWDDNLVGNLSLDVNFAKDFKFTTVASGKLSFWGDEGFSPIAYLGSGGGLNQQRNNLSRNVNNRTNWNWENYLTYSKTINEHNFSVLLGQGAYFSNNGGGNSFTLYDLPTNDYREASFGFYTSSSDYVASAYGTQGDIDDNWHKLTSLFGRINYNYKEKYLLTAILRRDGSNRFGGDNKYGVFPGASVGWNIAEESFWPQNNIVDLLKIRAGFGVTGNDAIREYGYLSLVPPGFNYTIGNNVVNGYAPSSLDNPSLAWETTNMINAGIESRLLDGLALSIDYYIKKTSGILRPVTIPGYVGVTEAPVDNVADMENRGIEIEMNYRHKIGPVDFNGSANFATLTNEVTYVASDVNYIAGDASFQGMGTITRTQVGESYNAFFGYQTAGIFQNQAEINAYTNDDGALIQPNARPGDFRWVDVNGDGEITDNDLDRTFLGTNLPKYTFGITLNFAFKGFDLMIFANGAGGNKIFQGLRRLDIGMANYSTAVLGRWTGEGTSDSYPRLTSTDPNQNFGRMSDFYLEDGDYLRFKIIQLGYSFKPTGALGKIGLNRLRPYVSGENLITFTKYTGFDPEVGGNVLGVDKGQYPQARSILFGVQVQF